MAFFDNIGKKASETAAKAVQRAQGLTETARLNGMISDEEKRINAAYSQIGKLYAELHREDAEEAFAGPLGVIEDAEKKICSYRKQIQDMKETQRCEKCGAEVSRDSAFCSSCGAQIIKDKKPADTFRCEKCGAAVTGWMRFCTACGSPLPHADIEAADEDSAVSQETLIPDQTGEAPSELGEDTEPLAVKIIEPEKVSAAEPVAAANEDEDGAMQLPEEPEDNVQEMQLHPAESTATQTLKRVCPHCGVEADDDQLFCIECGNSL